MPNRAARISWLGAGRFLSSRARRRWLIRGRGVVGSELVGGDEELTAFCIEDDSDVFELCISCLVFCDKLITRN